MRRAVLIALPILALLLLLGTVVWPGLTWNIEVVDSRDCDPGHSSTALDASGHPHISYSAVDALGFASWNGSSWDIQVVDSGAADPASRNSLALDADGHARICYQELTNCDLKYAAWNGASWDIETVDSAGQIRGGTICIALDPDGHPHISYVDDLAPATKYATWDGTSWHIEVLPGSGFAAKPTALALDATGRPRIIYGGEAGKLVYAAWNGTSWDVQTVDDSGNERAGSLVLDGDGHPHISYNDWATSDIRYAEWDGASWGIQSVGSAGESGYMFGSSLALDSRGYPCIAYRCMTDASIKYATWNGTSWDTDTVDGGVFVGIVGARSLALDGSDRPHISYPKEVYPGPTHTLGYALGQDPTPVSLRDLRAAPASNGVVAEFDWTDPRVVVGFELVRRAPGGKALSKLPLAPATAQQRHYHLADPQGRAGMTYEIQAVWPDGARQTFGPVTVR